jgi:uncharacterized membrane protein
LEVRGSLSHDARVSEKRNHLDLQINLLSEQENTKMLSLLHQIAVKIGANISEDPHIEILKQPTRPESVVEQIEETATKSATGAGEEKKKSAGSLNFNR